jgi:hypothetical protein
MTYTFTNCGETSPGGACGGDLAASAIEDLL